MFKTADPYRRTPVWLQAHTKENLIWNIKVAILFYVASELYWWYDDRKLAKKYSNL